MHTSYGDMDVAIPRDRNGDYESQLIKKYQNTVTQDMKEKILSMYAKGMTTGDIESHMRELYDIDISDSTISRITDKILPIVKEWQERPLEEVYAVVFMDAIAYNAEEMDQAELEDREPSLLPHFSVHNLRHTFCTRLCESTNDIKFIQQVMGHADFSTTMDIYTHITQENMKEKAEVIKGNLVLM